MDKHDTNAEEKPTPKIVKSNKGLRNVYNANVSTNSGWLLVIIVFTWLGGIVVAHGFWNTLFAICPLYGWYLLIEHFFKYIHFI